MGLFGNLLRNRGSTPNEGYTLKMVTVNGEGFYAWNGTLYKSDIIRSMIRPKVRAMGKMTPKHVRRGQDGLVINPDPYIRFLIEEPNPYMTGQLFREKMTTQLMLNNNAFALLVRNEDGLAYQMYPIVCNQVQVIYDDKGEIFLRFSLPNGTQPIFRYSDIVHLRRDFSTNDVFGDPNTEVLEQVMDVVTTIDQGIVKAIKNSNIIRWLLKFNTTLRPEDLEKHVNDFTASYLNVVGNEASAAATDAKFDAQPVEQKSFVPNAAQMDKSTARLMNYFNVNEKIIQSSFTEDQWIAYYEAEVEPDGMQLASEMTRKVFSRKQRGFGNKFVMEASNLHYASMKTKLNLMQMVDRGAMSPNEWRDIMNMAPVPGGDELIRRLDTAAITKGGGDEENED